MVQKLRGRQASIRGHWVVNRIGQGGHAHWALGLKEVALQVQEQNQVILYKLCLNNLTMFHG